MTHPISDCIGSIKGLSGSSTNGTITVQIFAHTQQNSQQEVYNVTLIQNTNGQWKIDTMTKKT
ncbi:hypothetical protein [Ktedonobacter racemifer]|uniref:DUF4878 domain-containing protein n=1 Tax=Ktedonobacter racemifer DSM 44963 TaxID=485913 RepID=D6TI85_KTERA|nr:hypothetical protein [Ktedonobacter racemifer]EFH89142.1 hypothetical protein Krac_10678 [Ktedonobacter racemifer DSM 44963]